jgi:hypothetical protein
MKDTGDVDYPKPLGIGLALIIAVVR